jgi:type I restriction enzyme, S subunit
MSFDLQAYQLDELCEFTNGFAFKSSDYVDASAETMEVFRMGYICRGGGFKEDNTPVFVPRAYGKSLDKFFLKSGDVVIAMTDMKDKVAILGNTARIRHDNRFVLNQRVGCIRVKRRDILDPDYFYFYSNSIPHVDYLRSRANSGVQVNLSTSAIKESQLLIPTLEVQKSVASTLMAIDDRITLLRETNATLEAIAQALFKSWFVDFDPVRAKMEGRTPEGMDEATAALFSDSFEETELGVVPKGWLWGAVSDFASFQNGYAFKSKDWTDTGHPVIKIGDVKPGIIDLVGCSYVANQTVVGLDKFRLTRGDLLVGMTGYVGETGLVPAAEPAAYLNQRVGRVATKSGLSDLGYVYCVARSQAFKNFAEAQSHGSAQANVSGTSLMSFPTVISPLKVIERFNSAIAGMLEAILSNHEQAQTLSTLRDTLLPSLISGQLSGLEDNTNK